MDELEAQKLEGQITGELFNLIYSRNNVQKSVIGELQPTTTISMLMARAAAQVLIAFERGYRMNEPETESE